jgi:SAM-dependent methyltransferase
MTDFSNPYDELPYRSIPIEWTAPEHLALASMLHGGPRQALDSYRLLELGCGNGANLLPLAFYRRHATFVGVDGAQSQIEVANERKQALGLFNIEFISTDFLAAAKRLTDEFDFIIAHGIFSWVPHEVRDALLELCARFLRRGGLLYLNYNARPGWNVRGMVREFLLAQTAGTEDLLARAQLAHEVAAKVASFLPFDQHPYSQLMANEFRYASEINLSSVAHDYLAAHNHPYWRSEFLALALRHDLDYVADANFCHSAGRLPEDLISYLVKEQITGRSLDDTVDLLCFRQLHSPVLSRRPWTRHPPGPDEFAALRVASCLALLDVHDPQNLRFQHPTGYQVEAKTEVMRNALLRLRSRWPQSLRVSDLFSDVREVIDDLKLLQRLGLIDLRPVDPGEFGVSGDSLNRLERTWGDYLTTAYHRRESAPT